MYKLFSILCYCVWLRITVHSFGAWRFRHQIDPLYATCHLQPSPGYEVKGNVYFRQIKRGEIDIKVNIEGLDTTDEHTAHGFHIHEFGDLTQDCNLVGSHYNPRRVRHGGPNDGLRHVGDLGNLHEDSEGKINVTMKDRRACLRDGSNGIIGRAVLLHLKEDDLGRGNVPGSLTGGNAGALMACCVIGRSNGDAWLDIE